MNQVRKFLPQLLLGLVLCSLASSGLAQEPPWVKGPSIEGITQYTFPNGLRFLAFPDSSASTITVNMTILVGSRHEGYGETGMAHLLEHMLFKGSKKFPSVTKALEAHGADYNGTTWLDRTNYFETMPASDENLKFGIELEADRLVNSFIKREDLVTEMTVVRNEFEMGENNPESILNQRMMAIAYEWHNYGKSTIGNRADIERVPIENLQAFYKKYYQPDNVVLIIAGKFNEKNAVDLVAKTFGALKAPERELSRTYTEEPAQDGERSVTLRRVGKVAVTGAIYHIPSAAHEDHPALEVLSTVVGDTPSGRLYKALVETKKATRVTGGAMATYDPGVVEMFVQVADKVSPDEVRDIMLNVIEKFDEKPATKEEVERGIRKYMSDRERALTKSKTIALELSEWAASGDWRLLFVHRDRVEKVTVDDVNRVAAKYLRVANRTVGTYYPTTTVTRATIPSNPDVTAIVKDYKGRKALAEGEAFDPTPANLDARLVRKELSSGVKLGLLAKKTRGEAVIGRVVLHFGNEKSLANYISTSSFVGSLMMRGTQKHTRQELEDAIDALKSKISVTSGLGSLSASFETKRGQLPEVLALLHEILREPSFPEAELDTLKRNQRQQIEKAMVDPQGLAFNRLNRLLNPFPAEDIRYVPTYEESLARLEKVDRAAIVKLYQEQIGGTHGEIVLVGDFDAGEAVKRLERLTADWKTSVPYKRIESKLLSAKGQRETINTPDKENAIYAAGQKFAIKDTDPDYAALELANFVLGNGLSSRLMERLRQKEGVSYGAGSRFQAGSIDPVGSFMVFAIANPENIEKVDTGAVEEFARLIKSGVTEQEIKTATKALVEEMKVDFGNDTKLAGVIRDTLFLGRTFAYYAELERRIAALQQADVNRALSAHLNADGLVIIRAGDFGKKK